jgi:hypothetical protein
MRYDEASHHIRSVLILHHIREAPVPLLGMGKALYGDRKGS